MRSVQNMLSLWTAVVACALLGAALTGCASPREQLRAPLEVAAPYAVTGDEAVWIVLPLRNESGTTLVDSLAVGDALVAAVDQVRGIRAMPMNRVLQGMRDLEMTGLRDAGDVRRLAGYLGAHGVVAGSITAYDPYAPVLGLSLALYPGVGGVVGPEVDPESLRAMGSEEKGAAQRASPPVTVVSETLDGTNQGVQMSVRMYAEGRSDPASALGWRRYLASMDLFTEYASWRMVSALMDREWLRLDGTEVTQVDAGGGR